MAKRLKHKDIDLLSAMNRVSMKKKSARRAVLIIVAVALLCALSAALLSVRYAGLKAERDALALHLSDSGFAADIEGAKAEMAYAEELSRIIEAGELADARLSEPPAFSPEGLSKVFELMSGNISLYGFSFERDTGTVKFSFYSADRPGIGEFVAALRESGIYTDVVYGGYSYESEGRYNFEVTAVKHV